MKKFMSIFMIALAVLVITGCSKDTTAPEIIGATDITINVGEEFDPKAGVTAKDDRDGDITANIQIFGTELLNINEAATYTLRYKVTDKAGNMTQVYRKVTVFVDTTIKTGMLFNGDFSQGVNGWDTLNMDGGSADFTGVNGELEIKMNSVSWQQFSPRLSQSGITFEQGKTYEVKFDARALEAKKVFVQVGELLSAAPWFDKFDQGGLTFEIGTTMETISFKFTMLKPTNENGSLVFEFGTTTSDGSNQAVVTTVYMDNIVITEAVADPDTTKPTLGGVSDVMIEKGTSFDPKAGVTVTDNLDATLTLEDVTVTGEVLTDTPGVYELTYTVTDASNNTTTVIRKVTVVELLFNPTTKITNGNFTNPLNETTPEWSLWLQTWAPLAAATLNVVDGELVVDVTATGDQAFGVQVIYNNLTFENGKTYKFVFDAKSSVARNINLAIGIDQPEPVYWTSFLPNDGNIKYSVTENYQTFEAIFTYTGPTTNVGIAKFELGAIDGAAPSVVTFDNVQFQELAEEAIIENGTMEATGWNTFLMLPEWGGTSVATFNILNGEYVVDITNVGTAPWNIQLIQENITLENGKTYKVVFKAKADNPRYFEMPIGTELSGWAEIDRLTDINVTTEYQQFEYTFTYSGDTVDYAKIKFELGQYFDDNGTVEDKTDDVEISANGKVYFDDVQLLVQDATDPAVFHNTNDVVNGTFDQVVGFTSWWGDQWSGVGTGSMAVVDGVMVIDLQTLGTAAYAPQVFQDGLFIKGNRTYVIEFDIKADVARSINVQFGEPLSNDPWFNPFMTASVVDVTAEWQHVVITLDMTQVTNENGKLVFELGTINGATGTNKVYIDNLIIYPNLNE